MLDYRSILIGEIRGLIANNVAGVPSQIQVKSGHDNDLRGVSRDDHPDAPTTHYDDIVRVTRMQRRARELLLMCAVSASATMAPSVNVPPSAGLPSAVRVVRSVSPSPP